MLINNCFVIFFKMAENNSILNEEDDHEDYPGDYQSPAPYHTAKSHIKQKENREPSRKRKIARKWIDDELDILLDL